MARATLSFDLPEEAEEHTMALNGRAYRHAVEDFDAFLRSKIRFGGLSQEQESLLAAVRARLHEGMAVHGVNLS